jgi:S1-C subfamily serine protease
MKHERGGWMKLCACGPDEEVVFGRFGRARRALAAAAVGAALAAGSIGMLGSLPGSGQRIEHMDRMVLEEGPHSSVQSVPGPAPPMSMSPDSCTEDSHIQMLAEQLRRSTVLISTSEGLGSGVIIARRDGETVILTNRHVVEAEALGPGSSILLAPGMEVHNDGRTAVPVRVMIAPQDIDLAIVVVREDIGPPARIGHGSLYRGTGILVMGSPLGIEDTLTRGVVSNFSLRMTDSGLRYVAIQTDAAINPGNSGGGLFLAGSGELVGITTFKLRIGPHETAEGMGFATPVSLLGQFPYGSWSRITEAPAQHQAAP